MDAPLLVLTDAPETAELALIRRQLTAFNIAASGINDERPLAVLAKDPATHEVLGGITGRTSRGILFIEMFFLPDTLRGGGLGSQLLQMAEHEGQRRGCRTALLYTNDFQAPGFYKKHGWREYGTFPCDPPGSSRIFFAKDLTSGEHASA